jgi:carboxyl-terminal processing protease
VPPPPPKAPREGSSLGLTALALIVLSGAVVFWAGLSLGSQGAGRSADERAAVEAFSETYRIITREYIGSPEPEALVEGAIEGMFDVLDDPYSRYLRDDEFGSALDDVRGEFEGVGAVMATEDAGGGACDVIGGQCRLRVQEVLAGAPAEAAGLLAGDVVAGVDGETLDGSTIEDSVGRIRGPRGSQVTLSLLRDGEELDVAIVRDRVVSESVRAAVLAAGEIGYVGIDSFNPRAAEEVESVLRDHLDAGIDRLVIDVRDDPGGFVDATVDISDLFLDGGAVFWEEDAEGRRTSVDASDGGLASDPDIAVVLLVNGGTASASEILAGALQDAGRARLVGERTFGKGTVQEWTQLPGDSGGFRLSVAKWLTRDRTWIDGTGLLPDVLVPGTGVRYRAGAADADPELDDQLQAAVALLRGEALPAAPPMRVPASGAEAAAPVDGTPEPEPTPTG